jgi:hypothetical protein
MIGGGGEAAPVGRPDFKPGWGRRAILGRFDSCSLPPLVWRSPFGLTRNGLWLRRLSHVAELQQGRGNN